MPLPKSLRRPVRRNSSSGSFAGQPLRKKCRTCNNLDPRGHVSTICLDETEKEPKAILSLVLDALSLANTKDVTRGGCRFCNIVIIALDSFFEKWRGARVRVNVDLKEKAPIKVSIDGERWKNDMAEIYAGSASKSPWSTLGTAHYIPVDSGSDDSFNFIRRCIQGCIANPKHVACRFACKSSVSAPKRLLDVGRAVSPIRLIDTQGKNFQYVALSHCWGSAPQLSTTKANWQKLAANISFNSLPPLFQDAVIITRQLGLRYIWIDSLCIIQDSLRDWETESSKMGSIYQNSYITISATNSGDGNARCLTQRRKAIKIPYENTTKKEFALRARKVLNHHPTIDPNGEPARPIGPLTFRAWALQEHVLSTRVLHYTATEMLFECKTSYRCECMPERKSYPTTPALIPKAVASKKIDAVWQAWQRIVEQYSKRSLTVASDKFPAISGIASKIRKATHSDYLAGLWKSNLASDMLWQASLPAQANAKCFALETWRAPSFSWASLDIPVTYAVLDEEELESFKPTITFSSSAVVPTGFNPLGTISEASLCLKGPTITATLCANQQKGSWAYALMIKGTSSIQIAHDCFLAESTLKTEEEEKAKTVRRAKTTDILRPFKAPVLVLSIARYDAVVSGIVLGRSERKPDAWERLGTFAAGTEALKSATEKELTLFCAFLLAGNAFAQGSAGTAEGSSDYADDVSIAQPTPTCTDIYDDELPAPDKTKYIPSSLRYNPTTAPKYTGEPYNPSPEPRSYSYDEQPGPYKSKYMPSSLLYDASTAPRYTGGNPIPLPAISAVETQSDEAPCSTASPSPSDVPDDTDGSSTYPIPSSNPGDDLGYGLGRPRPGDDDPSDDTQNSPSMSGSPERTPCTLETRVRPTATADGSDSYGSR